jgi:hypothetical protein
MPRLEVRLKGLINPRYYGLEADDDLVGTKLMKNKPHPVKSIFELRGM